MTTISLDSVTLKIEPRIEYAKGINVRKIDDVHLQNARRYAETKLEEKKVMSKGKRDFYKNMVKLTRTEIDRRFFKEQLISIPKSND